MSEVTNPLFLNETGKDILSAIQTQNSLLSALVSTNIDITDYATIQKIVQQGLASKFFNIGDQVNVNWTDTVSGTTYEVPLDVVHFGDVELKTGDVVPGMFLQWHYATPYTIMFDQSEALYYCDEALSPGTYHFTIGTTWGSNCVADTSYFFTTTVTIPAGGQIRIGVATENNTWAAPDTAVANWRVWTYASPSSTSCLEGEALELEEGTEGTDLGTTTSSIKYADSGINNLQRAGYGYNRWSQSAYRQYLNSSAAIGKWWEPQNNFDRAPSQLGTYPGFMSGFEDDFLNIIKPIKVTTVLNTASDSEIGTSEDTYDTWFLPSLEQIYIVPQLSGVEGDYWEYWRQVVGTSSPQAQYSTTAERITYAINAKTAGQNVRLRSAIRGYASSAWNVSSAGNVNGYYGASYAFRSAPGCVVC